MNNTNIRSSYEEARREAQLARKEARDRMIKEVIALRYEGRTCSEIAWELAIPESAVRALARRGGCED